MQAILSTTYFGPVQWFQKLCRYDSVLMERHDTFRKQTFRNRCVIATANGTQTLTVPVERSGDAGRLLTKDVRVSDHGNWCHLHWHALMTAYSESPFFEYYADDIRPFFERKWEFLYDFNMDICRTVCALLDITPSIRPTDSYIKALPAAPSDGLAATPQHSPSTLFGGSDASGNPASDAQYAGLLSDDFRDSIDPKHPQADADFVPRRYYQVFERKNGFIPNLSVLDLLFNMGPEAIFLLMKQA